MIGKIKILGLAFGALVAASAIAGPAAQAGTLHVGANPAVITGHSDPKEGGGLQSHVLSLGGGLNLTCATATVEGTVQQTGVQTQTVQELMVTPTYQQCTGNANIRMNGCKYTLTGAGEPANTYVLDIFGCTSGKQITIQTATCVVHIPEQNGLSHIVGKNSGPIADTQVTLEATVSKISVTQTGVGCPAPGESNSGSLSGSTVFQAFIDNGTTQMTSHNHQHLVHKCGAMVHLITT